MNKVLFIGDSQCFFEALRKQVQLSQSLSLEFLAVNDIKGQLTNLADYDVIILDIICLNQKKSFRDRFFKRYRETTFDCLDPTRK